ncbi:rhomboid family intramembrane serine protease [Intestinimonas sp.]|uniref:rhomboid family intramembrane serine protease n=1 Tax=Intestinimonas sp. TaxID=1965293 RepID=UPI002620808C|nr:rhomboid family intramembrane serine protease [Intestinimonas sp.]
MKKRIRISFNAPVVLWFAIICAVATLLNYLTNGAANQVIFSTYHSSLGSPLTYLRFVTHVFGHGDWTHLVGNMTYLLLLGPMLEEKYGSKTLVEVIAITAVVTAVANYLFFPTVALCGASGVVFAFILMSSFTSFKEGEIPLTFVLVAAFFIGREIIDGIFVTDQISNLAHIIGGIIGGLLGYGLNVKSRYKGSH